MVFPRSKLRVIRFAAVSLSLVAAGLLVPPRLAGQGPADHRAESEAAAAAELVTDAEAFMAAYAEDLRRGDRTALAARYDPAGVYELRPGRAHRSTHDAIAARYATDWQRPAAFEWRDLTYEVVGPDAVVVTGLFAWTRTAGGGPHVWSYIGLLRRQPEGSLRIRLEAEAGQPLVPWRVLGAAASVIAALSLAGGWLLGRRRERRARAGPRAERAAI